MCVYVRACVHACMRVCYIIYVTFVSVKVCAGTHKTSVWGTMTTCQYRAGVYVLEEGRAHIICNDTSDEHSTWACTNIYSSVTTQQHDRTRTWHLGGRCVAKRQYATVTRLRRHMHINSTAYRQLWLSSRKRTQELTNWNHRSMILNKTQTKKNIIITGFNLLT